MYAIVEDKKIVKTFNNPRKLVINNIRYSTKIYSLWSVEEKKAIGIYEVEYDNTNKKDEAWYINTNQTLAYDSSGDKVTASYGTATARSIADFNAVDDNGEPVYQGVDSSHIIPSLVSAVQELSAKVATLESA